MVIWNADDSVSMEIWHIHGEFTPSMHWGIFSLKFRCWTLLHHFQWCWTKFNILSVLIQGRYICKVLECILWFTVVTIGKWTWTSESVGPLIWLTYKEQQNVQVPVEICTHHPNTENWRVIYHCIHSNNVVHHRASGMGLYNCIWYSRIIDQLRISTEKFTAVVSHTPRQTALHEWLYISPTH